jgi:hypothetical protein
MPLIHIKGVLLFCVLSTPDATGLERTMAQTTIAYVERRYAALESEIADASGQSPTDEMAVADLKYRKLTIADKIQHNRRLVERFNKLSLLLG